VCRVGVLENGSDIFHLNAWNGFCNVNAPTNSYVASMSVFFARAGSDAIM